MFARAEALLDDLRRPDLAEKDLREHLAKNPEDGYALTLLARALAGQQKMEEAEKVIDEAVARLPDDSYAHRVRGWVLRIMGRSFDAEYAYRDALRLDPTDVFSYEGLACILLLKERNLEALELIDQALAIQPDYVDCLNRRAQALIALRRYSEAQAALDAASHLQPNESLTHANQGWLWEQRGRNFKALQHYRTSLELDPQDRWTAQHLCAVLRKVMDVLLVVLVLLTIGSVLVLFTASEPTFLALRPATKALCFLGYVGWWCGMGMRYPVWRLALCSYTPYGTLVAPREQLHRSRLLLSVLVLCLGGVAVGWLGGLLPGASYLGLSLIFVIGLPLITVCPGPDMSNWSRRLVWAVIPAGAAALILLALFLERWSWVLPLIITYAVALMILHKCLRTAKETEGWL